MKSTYAVLLLLFLTFFFGCISVESNTTQKFMDDGTSNLTINEFAGLGKNMMSEMGALSQYGGGSDSSTALLKAMSSYYSSTSYSSFLCSELEKNSSVSQCTPNPDGSISAQVSLSPGYFYTYNSTTDWVNLKEIRTYKIRKVPMATYFILSSDPQYQTAAQDNMNSYVESNIGSYFTQDYYCTSQYPLSCNITSYSGNTAVVQLNSSSYTPIFVNWVGCSNLSSDELFFVNSSNIQSMVYTPLNVSSVLSKTSSLSLNCPQGSQTIVVSYRTSDYSGGITTSIDELPIESKAQAEAGVLASLNKTSTSSLGSGSLGSSLGTSFSNLSLSDPNTYTLDLQSGMMLGETLNQWAQMSTGLTAGLINISLSYDANFPDTISSASMGALYLSPNGNDVQLSLSDLQGNHGPITVTTEKNLSPLGVYTWVVLVVIVLAVLFFVLKKKS